MCFGSFIKINIKWISNRSSGECLNFGEWIIEISLSRFFMENNDIKILSVKCNTKSRELFQEFINIVCFANLEYSTFWVKSFSIKDDNWTLFSLSVKVWFNMNKLLFRCAFLSKWINRLNVWRLHHNTLENTSFGSFSNNHSMVLVESV